MKDLVNFQGIRFLAVDIEKAIEDVAQYIPQKQGDYFCFANIHLVMEGVNKPEIKKVLNESNANFPDGMGVAWALKLLGHNFNGRVRGADFMLRLCSYASKNNLKIFLYGSTEEILETLEEKLKSMFPEINIVGSISPPFRELTKEEDERFVKEINEADPDILFVSLGASKQEKWMAEHKGKIKAVQLGVGAAFDFITNKVKQAPVWMQRTGLEWLYRLPQQPIKTASRMLLVPEFVFRVLKEFINQKMKDTNSERRRI